LTKQTHKKCNKCGETKPLSAFHKRPDRPIGVRSKCKACDLKEKRESFSGRLSAYKCGARKRNIEWDLSKAEFNSFWKKPCYYCGSKIDTIGIDRIDSSKGYTIDNVVSCCETCNKMKMALAQDVFVEHCLKVANNLCA